MKTIRIDLSQLYIGDYFADTLDFTADQHFVFQNLLLYLWLDDKPKLNGRTLRKKAALSWLEWRRLRNPFVPLLEIALDRVSQWKEAVKAYDGQRLPQYDWQIVRAIVMAGDDYVCAYCGSDHDLHVDHRIPVSRAGSNALTNLVTACRPCNQSKGPKPLELWLRAPDPAQRRQEIRSHPRAGGDRARRYV